MSRRLRNSVAQWVFAACAALVLAIIALLFFFIGSRSYQTFTVHHVNVLDFFTGAVWQPRVGKTGALVLIVGSVSVTMLAVLISTPISVGVAIFMSEVAPPWARRMMQPVLELFAGIPSVIYGFLGLVILVPLIARAYNSFFGAYYYNGYGLIAAGIVLAFMILPTITTISTDALAALPNGLREASLALGATRWQTIRRTLLPAASSGILTGVILGMGRAIGETLAVAYVIGGNANAFPVRIDNFYPYVHLVTTSTITVQILSDFFEVTPGSLDLDALWTLAFILLLISLALVLVSRWIGSRSAFNVQQVKATEDRPFWRRVLPTLAIAHREAE